MPNHQHQHQTPGHGVDLQIIIDVQREKIALLDDQATVHVGQIRQANAQTADLAAAMSQLRAENLILRGRLGIGDTDLVELTDDEVKGIGSSAQVIDIPDK